MKLPFCCISGVLFFVLCLAIFLNVLSIHCWSRDPMGVHPGSLLRYLKVEKQLKMEEKHGNREALSLSNCSSKRRWLNLTNLRDGVAGVREMAAGKTRCKKRDNIRTSL